MSLLYPPEDPLSSWDLRLVSQTLHEEDHILTFQPSPNHRLWDPLKAYFTLQPKPTPPPRWPIDLSKLTRTAGPLPHPASRKRTAGVEIYVFPWVTLEREFVFQIRTASDERRERTLDEVVVNWGKGNGRGCTSVESWYETTIEVEGKGKWRLGMGVKIWEAERGVDYRHYSDDEGGNEDEYDDVFQYGVEDDVMTLGVDEGAVNLEITMEVLYETRQARYIPSEERKKGKHYTLDLDFYHFREEYEFLPMSKKKLLRSQTRKSLRKVSSLASMSSVSSFASVIYDAVSDALGSSPFMEKDEMGFSSVGRGLRRANSFASDLGSVVSNLEEAIADVKEEVRKGVSKAKEKAKEGKRKGVEQWVTGLEKVGAMMSIDPKKRLEEPGMNKMNVDDNLHSKNGKEPRMKTEEDKSKKKDLLLKKDPIKPIRFWEKEPKTP